MGIKIPTKRIAAGRLQDGFCPQKQLLMLHFFFTKTEQRAQVRAVVVPVLLGDTGKVDRDKFLVVAKQMGITERTNMVERLLLLRIQELEVLGPHPRVGDNMFGGVKV